MGVFDDKRYEQLDWISQAVEPIESDLCQILVSLPDSLIIDYKTWVNFNNYNRSSFLSLYISDILNQLIATTVKKVELSYEDHHILESCYMLECDSNTYIDFEQQEIIGQIKLVKISNSIEPEQLKNLMIDKCKRQLQEMRWSDKDPVRIGEICDILGNDGDLRKTRSANKKYVFMRNRIEQILKENEWNIKNVELGEKIGKWIAEYAVSGKLTALTNLCKLKVMTHGGKAIYSMEEEK